MAAAPLDHGRWPWWQQCPFGNLAGLAAHLSVEAERRDLWIGKPYERVSLGLLGSLRAGRSDWHEPIAAILQSWPSADQLLWFIRRAPTAVLFATELSRAESRLAKLEIPANNPRDGYPTTGADALRDLRTKHRNLARAPRLIHGGAPARAFSVNDGMSLAEAARHVGAHITGGRSPYPVAFRLSWLRQLVCEAAWARECIAEVLFDLAACGDEGAVQAAMEYVLVAGDVRDLEEVLQLWEAENPAFLQRRYETVDGELEGVRIVADALERVAYEKATAPDDGEIS